VSLSSACTVGEPPVVVGADVENGSLILCSMVERSYRSGATKRPIKLVGGIYCARNLDTVRPRLELSAPGLREFSRRLCRTP